MAIYNDNDYKFVAVLNKKIEIPKLLNALGHISVGLTSLVKDINSMEFLQYIDGNTGLHPAISKFPFIVLSADNGNKIRTLRNFAIEQSILFNDFTDSMLGFSAENQLQQTASKNEIDLDYYAIVLFGQTEQINTLTKKFSLFRS